MSRFKVFLSTLFIFLVPVTIFLAFTEINLREYSNMYDQKKNSIELVLNDIEVLILGNSQSISGFDPEKFSLNTFNFAHDSQSLDYDIMITEKYLPQLNNLKFVIVPVSYFSFYYQLHHSSGSPRQYNYFFSYNIPIIDHRPLDVRKWSYIAAYSPRISFGIVYLNKFKSAPLLETGFSPRTGTISGKNNNRMAFGLMTKHNDLINKGDREFQVRNLEEFISTLKSKNIKVIFTSIPVSESYRKLTDPSIVEMNNSIIRSICAKYNCEYVDLAADLSLGDDYFSDIDHLNEKGAELTSTRLDSAIINN